MSYRLLNQFRIALSSLAAGAALAACGGGADAGPASAQPEAASAAASAASGVATAPPHSRVASTSGALVHSGVGTNLNAIGYYSSEMPTIDLMKKASPWLTQCGGTPACSALVSPASAWDTHEEASLPLDANGWVTRLPAADAPQVYRWVTTLVLSGNYVQPGNYVVRYDGSGTVTYGGSQNVKVASQSGTGRDVISISASTGTTNFWVNIKATDPTNYIRNIRVYPPGGACANDLGTYASDASQCTATTGAFVAFENFPAGSVWHPQFLSDLQGYRSLRFMDWGMTNITHLTGWSQRAPAAARTWMSDPGVPIEAMFDLSARTGADPWINIPPYADDNYVQQFGQLAHQLLPAGRTLHLEYGNEMWNYAFPATNWALAQAKSLYAKQLAGGTNPYLLEINWYAQRLVHVCQSVKAAFGADAGRVKCVANTQAASAWETGQVLSCSVAATTLGQACGASIDEDAIAPYFGYYIGQMAYRATVSGWYADPDGGLAKLFEEITGLDASGHPVTPPLLTAGSPAPTGAIGQAQSWMNATKAQLAPYGIPMVAYEGGQHLVPPAGDTDANFVNLITNANRDPRMGAAYQQYMSAWRAAAGQTFNFYTDVGQFSKYGMWGLKESQFDTTAPKWQAAVDWRTQVGCWWSGC